MRMPLTVTERWMRSQDGRWAMTVNPKIRSHNNYIFRTCAF
jgi:hypothetical protein